MEHTEKLSLSLGKDVSYIVAMLKAAGLVPAKREVGKEPRGYKTTENRWSQNPSHATPGGGSISGFAEGKSSGQTPVLGMRRHIPRLPIKTEKEIPVWQKTNPESDRERLRLIKEGADFRKAVEAQESAKKQEQELSRRRAVYRQQTLDSLHGEFLVLKSGQGSIKVRLERCMKYFGMIKLLEQQDPEIVKAMQSDIGEVKKIFLSIS